VKSVIGFVKVMRAERACTASSWSEAATFGVPEGCLSRVGTAWSTAAHLAFHPNVMQQRQIIRKAADFDVGVHFVCARRSDGPHKVSQCAP
jgi:hypothetical protein